MRKTIYKKSCKTLNNKTNMNKIFAVALICDQSSFIQNQDCGLLREKDLPAHQYQTIIQISVNNKDDRTIGVLRFTKRIANGNLRKYASYCTI